MCICNPRIKSEFGCKDLTLKFMPLLRLTLLSPNSDQHQISPRDINAYSTPEVMRIKDNYEYPR